MARRSSEVELFKKWYADSDMEWKRLRIKRWHTRRHAEGGARTRRMLLRAHD